MTAVSESITMYLIAKFKKGIHHGGPMILFIALEDAIVVFRFCTMVRSLIAAYTTILTDLGAQQFPITTTLERIGCIVSSTASPIHAQIKQSALI